jgi:hypothetical protein
VPERLVLPVGAVVAPGATVEVFSDARLAALGRWLLARESNGDKKAGELVEAFVLEARRPTPADPSPI